MLSFLIVKFTPARPVRRADFMMTSLREQPFLNSFQSPITKR